MGGLSAVHHTFEHAFMSFKCFDEIILDPWTKQNYSHLPSAKPKRFIGRVLHNFRCTLHGNIRWLEGTAACRSIKKEDEIPWNLGRITRDAVFLLVARLFEVSSLSPLSLHLLVLSILLVCSSAESQAGFQSGRSHVIKRSIIAYSTISPLSICNLAELEA